MRKPFGKLMLEVRDHKPQETLGSIAARLKVSVNRVMDAIDANKILRGEPAYINETGFVYVEPDNPPEPSEISLEAHDARTAYQRTRHDEAETWQPDDE